MSGMYGRRPETTEPAAPGRSNGLAVASLVCGIVGVFLAQVILGPLALVFGVISLRRANTGARHRGLALAGIILGAIDIILFIIAMTAHNRGFDWHTH